MIVYYWNDKITHLNIKLLKRFIELCGEQFSMSTSYSLFEPKFGSFVCISLSVLAISSSGVIPFAFRVLSAVLFALGKSLIAQKCN